MGITKHDMKTFGLAAGRCGVGFACGTNTMNFVEVVFSPNDSRTIALGATTLFASFGLASIYKGTSNSIKISGAFGAVFGVVDGYGMYGYTPDNDPVSAQVSGTVIELPESCEGARINDGVIILPDGCAFTTAPAPAL